MILRAGIIGSTGRGDYGHGLDTVYRGMPGGEVIAVADLDPAGARRAAERTGALNTYIDYRQMLEKERLHLVSVCPRRPAERSDMVCACAESGVKGIFCEKPFARTLAEADAMLSACERNGVRLVVAHQKRVSGSDRHARRLIEEGAIGDVQVIRCRGKGDHRAGAEDLVVLGPHLMDSMRWFSGSDAAWAFGRLAQDERDVTAQDAREVAEEIGPIAGNAVDACFGFMNGVVGYFESRRGVSANKDDFTRSFGMEIYGTGGIISVRNSPRAELYLYPQGLWIPDEAHAKWERIRLPEWEHRYDGTANDPIVKCNRLIVGELIAAITEDRDIVDAATGADGRAAVEMVMAILESHRLRARVELPMENREHPLTVWRSTTA